MYNPSLNRDQIVAQYVSCLVELELGVATLTQKADLHEEMSQVLTVSEFKFALTEASRFFAATTTQADNSYESISQLSLNSMTQSVHRSPEPATEIPLSENTDNIDLLSYRFPMMRIVLMNDNHVSIGCVHKNIPIDKDHIIQTLNNTEKPETKSWLQSLLDARLTRIASATAAIGLGGCCFYGEILQSQFGHDLYPMLTAHGSNAPHCFNMMLIGAVNIYPYLPKDPTNPILKKFKEYFPEVLGCSIAALNIIGETILPQILIVPNIGDPYDIPMALIMTGLCYLGMVRPLKKFIDKSRS